MKRLVTIVALLCLAGPLLRTDAAPIPIAGFSFEDPGLSYGAYNSITPDHWTDDGRSGVYNVGSLAADGVQVVYIFRSTLWQMTSAQLTQGVPYQLTVAAAKDDNTVAFTYALYSGNTFATGTLLKSATVALSGPALSLQDYTLTFGPSDLDYGTLLTAHAEENIIVAFTAANDANSVDMDNVRLSEVPEPTTLPLLGAGGFLLWRKRRSIR